MKKETASRRKEQGAETKKRLIESAKMLINKYGIDDVSVDAIVEAAGVSKGTFYVHFESKYTLLSSLITDYVDKVDMDYEAFLRTLPADAPSSAVLLSMVSKIFDVIENTIGYENIKTLYKVQITEPVHALTAMNYNRAIYQMFEAVLEKGIHRGEFGTSLPVEELTRHIMIAMRGLTYEWCIRYPTFNLKEQALTHFNLLLDGILAKRYE